MSVFSHLHEYPARAGAGFTLPGAELVYPPDLSLEPMDIELRATVDVTGERMDAESRITLVARTEGVRTIVLDAVGFERVEVESPGQGLAWRYNGTQLQVTFHEPVPRDGTRVLVVRYRVQNPHAGLYFSLPTETEPGLGTFAATDNETERARYWMPCIDHPSVRTTLTWHLRADQKYTVLANGELTGIEVHEDGTHTASWRLNWRCPSYLACFAIGDFVRADDESVDDVEIAYFTTREYAEADLRRSFGRTPQMLRWIQKRLGMAYPFPKYFQFAGRAIGGAMENISLVSWDDVFVMNEDLATEWTRLVDQINLHEMAHSWFGDAVVCRDYTHSWLKESWATYMEQVWFEETQGRDEADYEWLQAASAYFREADTRYVRPLVVREFNSSWQMYDAHLYPGGACRLHTLRRLVGDDAFWRATARYLNQYAGKVVETDHFRHLVEEESGLSLGKFFDQWIHSPGYPKLKVSFAWDEESRTGKWTIEQTQVDAARAIGLFDLALDVAWHSDGSFNTRPVMLRAAREVITVAMDKRPDHVRVDSRTHVLHRQEFNPGDDMLLHQLANSADILGRIYAGRELCKTARRPNLIAVRDAGLSEPFWGVRVEHVRSLASVGSQAAIDAVRVLIAAEQEPTSLQPMFAACLGIRDAEFAGTLRDRLEEGLPPRARAAALEALGAQGERAPLKYLLSTVDEEGFNGFAQAGAFAALARTRTKKALKVLMKKALPGRSPSRARFAAVSQLGSIVPWIPDADKKQRAVELLIDLLRDSDRKVRAHAVQGLRAAGDPQAIRHLERYRALLPKQDQVAIDASIADIRAAAPPTQPTRDIEALSDKLRRLEQAVQDLDAKKGKKG